MGAAFVLGLASAAFAADPVFGTWKTAPDDNGNTGNIQIEACGDTICGTLVKSFDADGSESPSEHDGKKIIWDMTSDGGGEYSGGKVWAPDRDKTYSSEMQLNGNTLNIQGCFLFVCWDGGTWTRVN